MRRALLAVALVALLVGVPVAVLAQDGEAPATKVVFALDDSGSMFGPNGSDPGMQRYDGVINLIEVLQRLLDDDDPRRVEVGAISFGSDAQQLSGLVSVRDTALADLLRSARDGASTRRSTDFLGALCLAWETATGAAAPRDSGCPNATGAGGQRADDARRIVVLVTDGAPASGSDALTFGAQPDPRLLPVGAGCVGVQGEQGRGRRAVLAAGGWVQPRSGGALRPRHPQRRCGRARRADSGGLPHDRPVRARRGGAKSTTATSPVGSLRCSS